MTIMIENDFEKYWVNSIDINYTTSFNMCKAYGKHMIKWGGVAHKYAFLDKKLLFSLYILFSLSLWLKHMLTKESKCFTNWTVIKDRTTHMFECTIIWL